MSPRVHTMIRLVAIAAIAIAALVPRPEASRQGSAKHGHVVSHDRDTRLASAER